MGDGRTDAVPAAVRIERAEAAIARFGAPVRALRCIGVTGTNGKTTTVNVLRALLDGVQGPSASIGTLGVLVGAQGEPIPGGLGLTTPGPDELQRVLRELVDRGVRTVVMEVSSHALDQHRVHGIAFAAAVFTNLTRDHLDYHRTMETYFAAKARLVEYLAPDGVAVVNADDHAWDALPAVPRRVTFGFESGDVRARDVTYDERGSTWTLEIIADAARAADLPATNSALQCSSQAGPLLAPRNGQRARVRLPLIGDFNVANALAASATAVALGQSVDDVAERLARMPQVPGRLEMLAELPTVLRDYAHTPDALERALHAVRPFVRGRLIVVFGAGGDRDAGKRPLMGGIAERFADVVIVTSDNPRTESPGAIIDDIERGMTAGRHERIEDRRAAIARALEVARPADVILLAGKGHETYQVIGTEKYPFDEKEVVHELMVRA